MTEFITRFIADYLVIIIVLLGTLILLTKIPKSGRLEACSRILMAGLTAYLFAKLIGSVFQPEVLRPFQSLGVQPGAAYLNNPGFPSDHVLFCASIAFAVLFETRPKKLGLMLLVLTFIVAIGRVVALVHTPLDVVGGLVIACLGLPWYFVRSKKQYQ